MFHILKSSRAKQSDPQILRLLCSFSRCNDDQTGFTLAEVLITLLIIGVVASLVVPNLINDTQEAEFHTAWKKAYSDLDQATRTMVFDNAGTIQNVCSAGNNNCLKNLYAQYLNISKSCNELQGNGVCWHNDNEWYKYSKSPITGWWNSSGIVLANGNLIRFESSNTGCGNNTWVGSIPKCGFINIDVNGFKGPNAVGRDIYFVILTTSRILPTGVSGDGYNDCNSTATGFACSAIFLYQ